MSKILPRIVVLKSNYNNKYLRYINEDGETHGFLQFSGEEAVSPLAKFEVEMAKTGNGLVHIRCCYNNKYWVRQDQNHNWIVAGAAQTEEDQSKWSCTLFQPLYPEDDIATIRFRHIQLGNYACLWRTEPPFDSCLFPGSAEHDKDQCDVFTIIDWESLVILPKHIAFKGSDGIYLSTRSIDEQPYLQFFDSTDIGDQTVAYEVFTSSQGDGTVRLKSNFTQNFWRRNTDNWILADSTDTTGTITDTLFWPVKVGDNAIVLRNSGNNCFCERLTAVNEDKTGCLSAAVPTVHTDSHLQVEETVLSREISNVIFRLTDSRIYNQFGNITMAIGIASNTTQESKIMDVPLHYTESTSSAWKSSLSLTSGIKTTIQSGTPFIVDGKVEILGQFNGEYVWGQTKTTAKEVKTIYEVNVPPMTALKVTLVASKGSCDVPFSYYQRDLLFDGNPITENKDDGVYTATNFFNFKYQIKEQSLL